MQALGLIETKGLLAAVESADAMLKAAEVTLIHKTYVGGGLVSIAVTGGVAAVKAAVEAGAAAVMQINAALLVSQHVIARPHDEIDCLLGDADRETDTAVNSEEQKIETNDDKENDGSSTEILLPELVNKDYMDKLVQQQGLDHAIAAITSLKVVKLRNLAREYKELRIAGRQISKADKQQLLEEIMTYYSEK